MLKHNQKIVGNELKLDCYVICDICKGLITMEPDMKQLTSTVHVCNSPSCQYANATIRQDELRLSFNHIRGGYYYKRQEVLLSLQKDYNQN